MSKKLTKSKKERKIFGVCGGIAEYFDVDPTLMRVIWIVFCCLGGSGIVAYLLAALIMPEEK
jgi:phage shock protein C